MNNEKITSFPFDSKSFPFNIEISGISDVETSYTTQREKSYCYILEYICSGHGTVFCNGKTYRVSAGDALILPKGSNHSYHPDESWVKIWFNIDGTLVSNLIFAYGLESTVVFNHVDNRTIFYNLYQITQQQNSNSEIMEQAAIQFHRILQVLYTVKKDNLFDPKLSKIKSFLDSNIYEKNLSVKSIAKELHISQTQIISIFKKAFNVTPYQYFQKKRIDIAASLLLNSNHSVKEIAEILNYSDQPSFSNCFKKITGMSPNEYRKSNVDDISRKSNNNNKFRIEQVENLPFELKVDRK